MTFDGISSLLLRLWWEVSYGGVGIVGGILGMYQYYQMHHPLHHISSGLWTRTSIVAEKSTYIHQHTSKYL